MQTITKYPKNTVGRDFVVGDLHGCYAQFEKMLNDINFSKEKDRMFSVGDLCDRGPDSAKCLSLLFEPWFHSVRGNHETMWLDAHDAWHELIEYASPVDKMIAIQFFTRYGGEIVENVEHMQKIHDALEALPYAIEVESNAKRIGIVHAEFPVDCTNWEHLYNENLWEFYGFEQKLQWGRQRVTENYTHAVSNIDEIYVGHTPMKEPKWLGNHCYIDTGAFLAEVGRSGYKLTCVEL